MRKRYLSLAVTLALGALPLAGHAACTKSIGMVLPLTGSLGAMGQENVKAGQLAAAQFNKAGGINGCTFDLKIADSRTQPAIAVDAAKKLVDIQHVPAIVGALSSGVSMAMLTSVNVPNKVVQISPGSTSPAFTALAKEGKLHGYWFRTPPSDALQGVAMAYVVHNKAKLKRVAVIYLNNPYGEGLAKRFKQAFTAYGDTVTAMVPYNPKQPSYRSEVTQALQGNPQGLFLVGYPTESATIMREWISNGGANTYMFPDALNSPQFIQDVGGKYLNGHVWGTVPGSTTTKSLPLVKAAFKRMYGHGFTQPYDTNTYDAVAVIALAMEAGKCNTGTCIKDHIRGVTENPKGTPIKASIKGFKEARKLLAEGKPIRYIGSSGTLQFNAEGDVSGPEVVWRVKGGKITDLETMSPEEIGAITKNLGLK